MAAGDATHEDVDEAGTPSGQANRFGGAINALAGLFGRASNQLIALGVVLLAARWLTPESFGAYSIASALVFLTRAMLYSGAFEYILKAPSGEEANTECLAINISIAIILGGILCALSFLSKGLFHTAEVGVLLLKMAPSTLLSATANWQESQLLRDGRVKSYYAVTTTAEIAAAVVTITLILLGFGLDALVAQLYTRLFMLTVVYRILRRPTWSDKFSLTRALYVAKWSVARYGSVVVNFLSNYSADILLGVFLSPAATGLYRASHRMVTGVSDLITNPMRLSAMTIFSRRAAEGAESGRLWGRVVAASLFVGWTAVAGLAAIAAQAAPLVLGPRWRAAGPIIAILCLQRACAFVDGATTPLLVAYGHARVLLIMQLAMAAGGVGLLALVAHRGVGMVALSSGATALITTISCCIIAIRRFDGMLAGLPKVLPVALGPPLVTGLAAFCASRLVAGLRLGEVSSVAIEVLAGGAAFVIASFFLRNGVMNVLQALNQPARPTEAAVP